MTETVACDIEMMTMKGLQPWQSELFTGFRKGELMVMASGRNTGKSQMQAYARMFDDIMNSNVKVSDMLLSEGTVYGSRYYTVEPVGGNWREMETWCTQTFGKGNVSPIWGEEKVPEPAQRWYANNRKFWFRSKKDRDWFLVMWRS